MDSLDWSRWRRDQREAAKSLLGAHITGWSGIEMAIREVGPDGLPQFAVDGVDCLQFLRLEIATDRGPTVITTYQSDQGWGLQVEHAAEGPSDVEPVGIFRSRYLGELPLGEIEAVTVVMSTGSTGNRSLAEVELEVGGESISLVAGEIEEDIGGLLSFRWLDESVLIFTDREAVASTPWTPPRSNWQASRHPRRTLPGIAEAVATTLESTPVGSDIEGGWAAIGYFIFELWNSHLNDVEDWPTDLDMNNKKIDVCYRAADDLLEIFGFVTVCSDDGGPNQFVYRARLRPVLDGAVAIDISVEPPPRSGGPMLVGGEPKVVAETDGEEPYRIASLVSAGRERRLNWIHGMSLVETVTGLRLIDKESE